MIISNNPKKDIPEETAYFEFWHDEVILRNELRYHLHLIIPAQKISTLNELRFFHVVKKLLSGRTVFLSSVLSID